MSVTYKIGEAAALLRLKTYVLRFWETEFPQIAPLRTEKGQRLYTEEHLALLDRIRFLLHEHGLTIEGARKVLSEEASRGVRYTRPAAPGLRPAPIGSRGGTGISVSGHKAEAPLAGRSGANLPHLRFPPLAADKNRRAEPSPAPQPLPRPPAQPPPSQPSSTPVPLKISIRPSPARTEKRRIGESLPPFPQETAVGRNPLPASPEGPPSLAGGNAPPERGKGADPARLSPEKAENPDPRRETRSRRDIVEELEAVAALLRGAPSGKKP